MDRRIIGLAVLAFVISLGVLFAEVTFAGILAAQSGPTVPHDITLTELEWRGLWHSVLFIWGLPSALGALIIACFKPRRWRSYSVCAILPGVCVFLAGVRSASYESVEPYYQIISSAVNMALIPLFLRLFYAIIDRHSKTG